MSNPNTHEAQHDSHGGSMKAYVIGFLFSIILTIIPLVVVMNDLLNKTATTVLILVMAILQFIVQLVFFMHIRDEEKPRYNLMALIFGLVILLTIVAGSIWIMTYNTVG
ncbi:cytochrome o ubiquinol oxidase subunit IV [Paenibacillus sp. FSL H8-0548]|uniref:cytochrome o ubiquinol oxidase subunit IV n=1 Tax=Paenibacillus sp. FSL H8-0548 TaxID=1920422 RepID=UPI00096FB1DA|nr:cytochrome o ubiquinol oxidase subunit IV [Paenibacillus sp. FSL H8-0548]OMF29087.1 cytochrome o ubiquinol oxidase subunit IV [Paenibacillus sp. FSL H8-0548]